MRNWGIVNCAILLALCAGSSALSKSDDTAAGVLQSAADNRETWGKDFPGFHAKLVVEKDNRSAEGSITVSSAGKVEIALADDSLKSVATELLGSMIAHRFPGKPQYSAATFGPDDKHPQGRSILLNDMGQSMMRVRDGRIMQVNRSMGPSKFTIDMLLNRIVEDDKYLPVAYTVTFRNAKTGALERVDTYNERFAHVEKFYLPARLRVVSAGANATEVTDITLSSHELNKVAASN